MLLAKINPTAKIAIQVNPFSHEFVYPEFMTVVVNNYTPNAESVSLHVYFGSITNPVPAEEPQPSPFKIEFVDHKTFTSAQLDTWGVDDKSLLEIVANAYNVSITDYADV